MANRNKEQSGTKIWTNYTFNEFALTKGGPEIIAYCREEPYRVLKTLIPKFKIAYYGNLELRKDTLNGLRIGSMTARDYRRIESSHEKYTALHAIPKLIDSDRRERGEPTFKEDLEEVLCEQRQINQFRPGVVMLKTPANLAHERECQNLEALAKQLLS